MDIQNTTTYATDKAYKEAYLATELIGSVERYWEEYDDESKRKDVFSLYVEMKTGNLVKFVFTKKTGKIVYSKDIKG